MRGAKSGLQPIYAAAQVLPTTPACPIFGGMRAIVVGGGIGGLCAGIALQQAGVEARVYEAAPHLASVGQGPDAFSRRQLTALYQPLV